MHFIAKSLNKSNKKLAFNSGTIEVAKHFPQKEFKSKFKRDTLARVSSNNNKLLPMQLPRKYVSVRRIIKKASEPIKR